MTYLGEAVDCSGLRRRKGGEAGGSIISLSSIAGDANPFNAPTPPILQQREKSNLSVKDNSS